MDGYKGNNPEKIDVGWWITQIRRGLAYRKECAYESKWPTWRQYYRNEFKPDILPSNLFFKMIRTTVPRIYFRNPSISVIAAKPGIENFVLAKLTERVDNKLIKQMRLKKHLKRQVQRTWMFGTGVGKLGFGSQFHSSPEEVGDTEAPLFRKGQESVEYNFDILPNMPWYSSLQTGAYILPAGVESREEARWEAFFIRRNMGDVKVDSRLKNTRDLKPMKINYDGKGYTSTQKFQQPDMVDMFEIRDKKTGMVFIISPQNLNKELAVQEDAYLRLGIEVGKTLVFNEDDERAWGLPDSQQLEPQQLEINEIRTISMYHRRLSTIKMLCKRNAMLPEEAAKLLNPEILALAWTEEEPDQVVKILQAADIPDALLKGEIAVMNDVRENMGFGRNEFGEFQGGRESPTATETKIVKQASEIRVDERRDMVADLLVEIVEDSNSIIFENWNEEQVIDVAGPAGIPIWVKFRPSMLRRGRYELKVDPDSSLPETKELREQKALILYEQFKQNPLIDPVKLTQYLLHNMHGVAFDDMMRGIPNGMGLQQDRPLNPDQFGQVMKNVGAKAPRLVQ